MLFDKRTQFLTLTPRVYSINSGPQPEAISCIVHRPARTCSSALPSKVNQSVPSRPYKRRLESKGCKEVFRHCMKAPSTTSPLKVGLNARGSSLLINVQKMIIKQHSQVNENIQYIYKLTRLEH